MRRTPGRAAALSGFTLLMTAVSKGDGRLAELLLRRGAEVGQQTACGKTALFMAAHSGRGCIIEKLLCYGASVEKRDMAGVTALKSAVRRRG